MGLWLETRDDKGTLTFRGRFVDGVVDQGVDHADVTLEQAIKIAKLSVGLPLEERSWVLRIGFDD